MSVGYGGKATLMDDHGSMLLYSYCSYNLNDKSFTESLMHVLDGEIYIDRNVVPEPEIHTKICKKANGRKYLRIKRIKKDASIREMIVEGFINVRNSVGTWRTDDCGTDIIALRLISKIFGEYQETGEIPAYVSIFA